MIRSLCTLLCVVFLSSSAFASEYYLIKVSDNAFTSLQLQELGVQVEEKLGSLNWYKVRMPQKTYELLQTENDLVQAIEPDYEVQIIKAKKSKGDYPEIKSMWGMQAIDAAGAWDIQKGSKKVIIAVSDTGIWGHKELKPNFWQNPGETGIDENGKNKAKNKIDDDGNGFVDDVHGWSFITNTNNISDSMYHGTHVSGTIGAVGGDTGVAGVSWKVSLMAGRFFTRDGRGDTSHGIQSILYASDNGARVINCSWGTTERSQALYEAIEYAKEKGVLIVVAAGNAENDNDANPYYPAAYESDNVITVAAAMKGNGPVSFTNWGATTVDLAAPGDKILSTFNPTWRSTFRKWYYWLSGTSMAAPHVTGTLALMFAEKEDLGWEKAKEILLNSVEVLPVWKGKTLTGGMLNAKKAVEAVNSL